ncbi:TPR repeat protein [Rhizomicrobium palustre]|uniref:TPR repeat protein n=1 Tax=Rhizomicrobium palustre TaxID=189966 RepID=A0A846N235_9PROT|nr:tetratricopeptide repeat protein [Rhizomicrobium palustre]NIK89282.1 TPR repeat protein [Rhizomicrobium palustre]
MRSVPQALPRLAALFLAAGLLTACAGTLTHDEIQAKFDAGLKAYDAGDYAAAFSTWKDIQDVDVAALRNLALMLRKGQGIKQDLKAAREKMTTAADMGLVTAQYDLAEMYLNGEGAPRDVASAIPWLERAAAAGHPFAAFELGKLLEAGDGIAKDPERAQKLFQKAASSGVAGAAERLKTP